MLEDNYVFHKLYNKHSKSKLCESTASQQSIIFQHNIVFPQDIYVVGHS